LLFGYIDICCLCLKQLQLTSANLNYHYVIKINDENGKELYNGKFIKRQQ